MKTMFSDEFVEAFLSLLVNQNPADADYFNLTNKSLQKQTDRTQPL